MLSLRPIRTILHLAPHIFSSPFDADREEVLRQLQIEIIGLQQSSVDLKQESPSCGLRDPSVRYAPVFKHFFSTFNVDRVKTPLQLQMELNDL